MALRMRRALVLSVFLLAIPSVGHAKKPLTDIPLVWRPTTESEGLVIELTRLENTRIRFVPLADRRESGELIGQNVEDADEGKILPVTTKDDIGAWCTEHVRDALENLGLAFVDERADVTLTGDLERFFVKEENTYKGDVRIRLRVEGSGGELLWSGIVRGTATRFGRSYKAENYYEVLSDSLLDVISVLIADDDFIEALAGS